MNEIIERYPQKMEILLENSKLLDNSINLALKLGTALPPNMDYSNSQMFTGSLHVLIGKTSNVHRKLQILDLEGKKLFDHIVKIRLRSFDALCDKISEICTKYKKSCEKLKNGIPQHFPNLTYLENKKEFHDDARKYHKNNAPYYDSTNEEWMSVLGDLISGSELAYSDMVELSKSERDLAKIISENGKDTKDNLRLLFQVLSLLGLGGVSGAAITHLPEIAEFISKLSN